MEVTVGLIATLSRVNEAFWKDLKTLQKSHHGSQKLAPPHQIRQVPADTNIMLDPLFVSLLKIILTVFQLVVCRSSLLH